MHNLIRNVAENNNVLLQDILGPLRHAHVVEGVLLPEVGALPSDPPEEEDAD